MSAPGDPQAEGKFSKLLRAVAWSSKWTTLSFLDWR